MPTLSESRKNNPKGISCWTDGNLEVELEASAELGSSGEVERVEVRSKGHLNAIAQVLKEIC